jgi:SAM-dependent methyltransferase
MENNLVESFEDQPEFLTTDPSYQHQISTKLVMKDFKNCYLRFSHWATPAELKNKSILDIGCRVGATGGYIFKHGAARYVGIDNEKELIDSAHDNLKKYYPNSDYELHFVDAEEFVYHKNKEKFDIVFVGRVLHYIKNGALFLEALAKIADMIVIEDASPPLMPINYLLKHVRPGPDIDAIIKHLEYGYSTSETDYFYNFFKDYDGYPFNTVTSSKDSFIGSAYTIGFLCRILNKQGFKEDFEMYENAKKLFPQEYGFGMYDKRDGAKKYILRFMKEDNDN